VGVPPLAGGARIEAQRLAGVRAFCLAMSVGLLDDLDGLADVGVELHELQPTLDAARRRGRGIECNYAITHQLQVILGAAMGVLVAGGTPAQTG
jgi:hypothetical protein